MILRACIPAAVLMSVGCPVTAIAPEAERRAIEVRSGETVEMTVNGQPVRFRMVPEAISVPTVNADTAQRIALKPSLIGYIYVIGPERIGFNTDRVRYGEGEGAFRVRTAFSQRQLVTGADGIAGPETFPFGRTRFILRDPQPGDRAITFLLDRKMGDSQTSVRIDVGGRPVYAAFSIDRAESLVTATGGRWIADANGGFFDGDARAAPILYGVSRPVRSLKLQRPLMLGELEVRNLAVRVSDIGNARGIAEGAAPEEDPNEIVVVGDSKRKVPNQRLYIGMDTIGHCASIDYDFAAGTVTLMCPPRS
ncbi:hypothetical protein ACNI3Q_08850 [Sphingomonas sp. FW199]|uniref:hypothetical protein n=1 Tax=Sphingomonas sp. FW199 TaxID=3400217 RepID=UPI003CF3B8DB